MPSIQSKRKQRIDTLLANHSQTRDYAIETADDNGVITLVGTVPSKDIKALAERLVRKQQGVTSVINALDVRGTEDEAIVPRPSSRPHLRLDEQ